jgi:hypothetical protein
MGRQKGASLPEAYNTRNYQKVNKNRDVGAYILPGWCAAYLPGCRSGGVHFGGAVISMAQMAAGRIYMEAR